MPSQRRTITCPHCEVEIETLNFTCDTSGWESGTVHLRGQSLAYCDTDTEDSEQTGSNDYEYRCPECDQILSGDEINDLLAQSFVETKKKKKEKTTIYFDISGEKKTLRQNDFAYYPHSTNNETTSQCPHCGAINAHNKTQEIVLCPKCEETYKP